MSEPWTPEERARRLAVRTRQTEFDAFGRLIGFALGLVLLVLIVAGMAGLVAMIWRQAVR